MHIRKSTILLLWLLLWIGLFFTGICWAQDSDGENNGEGVDAVGEIRHPQIYIRYQEPLEGAARQTADIYPEIRAELETVFGWKVEFIPGLMLVKDTRTFERVGGRNYISAFAAPRENWIVIDYSRMTRAPYTLPVTLKHELVHLLLHHYIEDENLPRWLNEGVAQWASGGVSELMLNTPRPELHRAVLTDGLIPLRNLENGFPGDRRGLILAYAQSLSIITYILHTYEENGLGEILGRLSRGETPQEAVQAGLGLSLPELEADWHRYLGKRNTLLTFIAINLYEILFFLAALTAAAAFFRQVKKRRNYRDEEEDEDADAMRMRMNGCGCGSIGCGRSRGFP